MSLNRRELLRAAALVGVGAAVTAPVLSWQRSGPRLVGKTVASTARLPEPFSLGGRVPAVLAPTSSDAHADHFRIVSRRTSVEILPGYQTEIWGYNGQFPGPTLVTRTDRTAVVTHRNLLPVPIAVHLHGGHVPAGSDGYPTDYLLPVHRTHAVLHPDPHAHITRGERRYVYPNHQPAATLWYHDHRMDFTGAAVWRGLAGLQIVTDEHERSLPLPRGARDIPILLADRSFGERGELLYPAVDETALHDPGVTEPYLQGVLGDVILANGVPWPVWSVAAVRHRIRWLNGSNARVYRLRVDSPHRLAPPFVQIGSDGGLLEKPQELDHIDISPGERFEVILDLSGHRAGDEVTVVNDFGDGNTVPVLRFRVTGTADDPSRIPDRLAAITPYRREDAVRIRDFSFRQGMMKPMAAHGTGHGGDEVTGWLINAKPFDPARADTTSRLGDLEIWRVTTDFNHPVHVHLNPFQVLSRNRRQPLPGDRGWKDTLHLGAGEVAELAITFTDYAGRFLMHCHNLEHEDMAMMSNVFTVAR